MSKFSSHSLNELKHVHPELTIMCTLAMEYCREYEVDFMVFDGIRTLAEQRKNVAKGVSWTLDSYHIPQADRLGYAVDLVPYVDGAVRWDSPNKTRQKEINLTFKTIAEGCKLAIEQYGLKIQWGYDLWGKDKPHWQRKRIF